MDVYEAVTRRRSIRRFKNIPVDGGILDKCINAARLAPAGKNRQVCEYIIVDDERLLPRVLNSIKALGGQLRPKEGWPPEHNPKAYIITLINKTLEAELGAERRTTNYDAGMATENIILAAFNYGVGSCPLLSFEEDKLRQALNIPSKYDIAIVVSLGFPDESPVAETVTGSIDYLVCRQGVRHVPKRKLEDITHRNKFPQ